MDTSHTSKRMPTYFIPHGGGPCFFMDWDPPHAWDKTADYLRSIKESLPQKPKAILLISAHWDTPEFTLLTKENPGLYFDYYGFPPHTYKLEYPAPNDKGVAARIRDLLGKSGITLREDAKRDYDHGVFIPLKVAFPAADIPVVQLSLKSGFDVGEHIALGEALAPLRDEGVLIIGSGMTYHNLPILMASMRGRSVSNKSVPFDAWLSKAVESEAETRKSLLQNWKDADGATEAHPEEEHLFPLMVTVGAALEDKGRHDFTDHVMGAQISAYRFG